MNRKPEMKRRLREIADTMAHFSRVARKPVWFTYDQIWDIMRESKKYSNKRNITWNFPNSQQFGRYAAKHLSIKTKRISVKLFHELPKTPDNVRYIKRYAYFHPEQYHDEGVDYGGGE